MRLPSQSSRRAAVEDSPSFEHASEETVRALITPGQAVAAIENAFGPAYDSFIAPVRQHIATEHGAFLMMPCYNQATNKLGVKLVAVAQHRQSDSTVQASYFLFDPVTAEPRLSLPGNWLTDLRTAATSFVATKFLARGDARILGIFGTGRQARAHLELFTALWQFDSVMVCGSSPERTRKFVDRIRSECNLTVEVADANVCATHAHIICTCTTSRQPLFDGNLLQPGTHLNLVGAFQPDSREVDSATIRRARIVVDTYAGALTEAGDLLIPLSEGAITRQHIYAELHEVVSGAKSARQNSDEITLFKSVGCALEDLALAELVADKLGSQASSS